MGHCKSRGLYIYMYMEKEMKIINWKWDFCTSQNSISTKKSTVIVSDRMSHIVLRGCWCNIIVSNVYAPREEKSDDLKTVL